MLPEAYLKSILDVWNETKEEARSVIYGNSMAPLMRHGDLIRIRHGIQRLRRGDILVFRNRGKIIAHRLIYTVGGGKDSLLFLKGDQGTHFDEAISPNGVIGKVVAVEGSNKEFNFDSILWRLANFSLAALYLADRDHPKEHALGWKALKFLLHSRSRIAVARRIDKQRVLNTICKLMGKKNKSDFL